MPVIDGDELLSDLNRVDELSPPRYALILAVCAVTRTQLAMDNTKQGSGERPGAEVPPEPRLTGGLLLSLAEASLRQFNLLDDTGLDAIVASYLVGTCYGNMNNIRHASFYLDQSISLAHSLNMTRESGYHGLSDSECEKRRRLFWLLFVTERTFALQHRRPVMLRNSITKPKILDSEYPVIMNDFVNHIRLFESLPPSLYEWEEPDSKNHQRDDLELLHTISGKLCAIQADQSVIESQKFDTLVTQQWLRISMWRLALGKQPSPAHKSGRLLPPSLPMDAGKIIIPALNSVGSRSKDCHGIAMEQKLFDVGVSLTDSALMPSWSSSSLELGPRDLLFAVVEALSTARGCQSYLLTTLLKYSEHLLAFADPAAHIDLRVDLPRRADDPHRAQVSAIEDTSSSTQDEESVNPQIWFAEDELSLLDLSTPGPSSLHWEDVDVFGEQVDPDMGALLP
ncbi:related to transcription activator amyR [Cephalotrichum gorgonifer]|uniref:Related to transcription activator amyR n=1 Tax=Cephalotrichum gorgonifer TaxID=2041049 RepID=A0AAE8MZ05_9PEZI|nr:related to transcription activator amyR [Cephalotrichum gorgonifer]